VNCILTLWARCCEGGEIVMGLPEDKEGSEQGYCRLSGCEARD
jgi:hypothetical protein